MAEHTPGPWDLCDRGDYNDFDGESRVVCAPINDEDRMGMRLAVVQVSDGDYFHESEANARLIAAAPELLEALEFIKVLAASGTVMREKADAAIARAKGGAP